jgi:hypothetical protein
MNEFNNPNLDAPPNDAVMALAKRQFTSWNDLKQVALAARIYNSKESGFNSIWDALNRALNPGKRTYEGWKFYRKRALTSINLKEDAILTSKEEVYNLMDKLATNANVRINFVAEWPPSFGKAIFGPTNFKHETWIIDLGNNFCALRPTHMVEIKNNIPDVTLSYVPLKSVKRKNPLSSASPIKPGAYRAVALTSPALTNPLDHHTAARDVNKSLGGQPRSIAHRSFSQASLDNSNFQSFDEVNSFELSPEKFANDPIGHVTSPEIILDNPLDDGDGDDDEVKFLF